MSFMAQQTAKATISSLDSEYTLAAFHIEKELGTMLTPDYPALKFVMQVEELGKFKKQEAEARKKANKRK